MLDKLLQYHDTPAPDDFTSRVMKRVQRRQRVRQLILWGAGVVGAGFGAAGMLVLAEPLNRVFIEVGVLPACMGVTAAIGFFAWLFQDEATFTG